MAISNKKIFIAAVIALALILTAGLTVTIVLAFLPSGGGGGQKASLHDSIAVSKDIYVQHDENNNDVYDLKKSGTGVTTVYKPIFVTFTANKAWTRDGRFIDNTNQAAHGATAPDDYIAVTAGEEYFLKIYGVAITDGIWYVPVLFLDDDDNIVTDMLSATFSASKSGVEITVPENATKMHITMYNNQNFTLQKVLRLTDKEFDGLPVFDRTKLETQVEQKYEEYKKDKTVYRKIDECRVTFVIDDTRAGIDEYADLFISHNIPLVLATIPQLLIENASRQTETRLQAARRVQNAGGEIIAHNDGVLTQDGLTDYNTLYSFFVKTKQVLEYYDFDINGIILAGGIGQIGNTEQTEKWASAFYDYSDLYGVEYDKKEIALGSTYYHPRTGLSTYGNNLEKIKQAIDNGIQNKEWLVFYFHDEKEIDTEVLKQLLEYVNSKSDELKVVTYKQMYDETAAKESDIINTKTTYYVSSSGTSTDGTKKTSPMSYETACNKTYISGDTVLFKAGDTFYGAFNPKIAQVDENVTTFSSYGSGAMPVITGYKIAASQACWQAYSSGVYRIDLTDGDGFSGLSSVDTYVNNIGFIEDKNGVKYYVKKASLGELESEYDFYCDGTYLYIKSDANPYAALGELKLATRVNLFTVYSYMKITNIEFSGTGAHGLVASAANTENVEISNNIIQDIGGSYLSGSTRYGNGIEFYATNACDITVKNNIIRNVYDVGFTMQGNAGSGKNVIVSDNVFVNNSQDSEIWGGGAATGVESYEFTNNISINCGRGWGYYARPDRYASAHILFWAYKIENTDIYFHGNTVYNARRIYFVEQTNGTDVWFKETNYIKSDYNKYYLAEDSTVFRDYYKLAEADGFTAEYGKDAHSEFLSVDIDDEIVNTASVSDSINEIKRLFVGLR